ncbi:endonuclease/exonuclease/phosphatase family metal-dependent hydrolase [Sphingomonas sp. BK036]|uniref:endonuclease/exonuclease/phosphatase family protein n=1 Tax=Sphingomonas sp. BK036 TaxID=2512122 RepID=UPI001028D863|nr:endonuclease/exonuclease/phosphatase family protein [Sphingomonas sp. BK036]RZT56273.1 endonuclease/exonuclease/phosphatase family metal-dependent hydrolase [Sphingomonas sp. BK036]
MIKVASYNIHKGIGLDRRRNPERVVEVLREIDADVIALQEADRRFGAKACVLPHHLLEEHSDWVPVDFGLRSLSMGWHGNVILVRKSAEILGCTAIHLPALEPRGAVMADVRLRGGTIRVLGMHLDLSGLWRRKQAAAVMTHVDTCADRHPTVMMGDLNEWSAGSGCLRDFGRDYAFAETGPSFHSRRAIARLDRIMVSRELGVVECGVHTSPAARKASDHLPIWAMLEPMIEETA